MGRVPEICPLCKGEGKIPYPSTTDLVTCHRCHGTGLIPKRGTAKEVREQVVEDLDEALEKLNTGSKKIKIEHVDNGYIVHYDYYYSKTRVFESWEDLLKYLEFELNS